MIAPATMTLDLVMWDECDISERHLCQENVYQYLPGILLFPSFDPRCLLSQDGS